MKKVMNRCLAALMGLLCLLGFVCCAQPNVEDASFTAQVTTEEGFVAIFVAEIEEEVMLSTVMEQLQADGQCSFTFDATGMMTELNGVRNAADWSACWMLYLDDGELADTNYTKTWQEKTYGLAPVGATQLPVKGGCTYLWSYDRF